MWPNITLKTYAFWIRLKQKTKYLFLTLLNFIAAMYIYPVQPVCTFLLHISVYIIIY